MNKSLIEDISKIDTQIYNQIINNNNLLTINFEEKSNIIINNFFNNNIKNNNIYFKNNYKINIDLINDNFLIYLFFIKCVEKATFMISKSNYKNLFEPIILWSFSICNNIMFNYPFTMENVIFFPIKFISECYLSNNLNKLIKTLIHEKIHINQRLNELEWDNFINLKDNNWIKIKIDTSLFNLIENSINSDDLLKEEKLNNKYKFIINPDTYYRNFKYIYLLNNIKYYGHYVIDNYSNLIKILFFKIDLINNKLILCSTQILEQEHPYEIFAYKISDEICKELF